ncbi:hypothetical protein HanHA300_Chr01g0007471 [Helianthus annuus]|nr:hypothetical protein HanHA300_Chr01g0007471 [Helianthus annuus]KAJ0782363.1 hypothetical protein HanLR1_Chr01g0007221 [Helianthus annuus]
MRNSSYRIFTKFYIPFDPYDEVITNLCLEFDLGLNWTSNCSNSSELGFLKRTSDFPCVLIDPGIHFCVCLVFTTTLVNKVSVLLSLVP